jgi:hypothetical protein
VVPDLAADGHEDRLVRLDAVDEVLAGDVRCGRDDDAVPRAVLIEVDRNETGMSLGRSDRPPVPGARDDEIVGVLRRAGELVGALAPKRQ